MLYRQATVQDAPALVALGKSMTENTAFAPPTLTKVERLIARKNGYFECAIKDDQMIGFLCGHISETFLNDQVNAYDQGVYVLPEHRGGKISVQLIRNFERWAKEKKAENIWLSQSVNHKQQSTLNFFERLGYKCQGFVTCKKL